MRLNVVKTYRFLLEKHVEYWLEALNKWFMSDKYVVVRPSSGSCCFTNQ